MIGMAGFTVHSGKIAVYAEDNIDTDRIMPARFLTMVTRSGYGENLFCDVRGPGFPLDEPSALGADVLVVGTNFGCGSSREHAVWGIQQGGFRAVIALKTEKTAGYSDIFRQNSANCGLLLIELEAEAHSVVVGLGNGAEVKIDLPNQTVAAGGFVLRFEIAPATKDSLIKGLDLIGTTLEYSSKIEEFEKCHEVYTTASM